MKFLIKKLHQSHSVVFFCIGVVVGTVAGMILQVRLGFEWWILGLGGILIIISLWRPLVVTMILPCVAGFLLSFVRVGGVLVEMDASGETWALNAEAEKYGLDGLILNARDWFAERISGLIPEPEVKLGLSYLLGMKSGLPKDLSESLRVVGLTHIVVASGAHLSILVEVARKIFGKVSRFAGVFGATGFILFFMAMVGWTPSIMRAGIMAILTIVTWYVGRKIAPVRMILMVMAGTLLIDPTFLTNLGWMLSFASYAGVMLVGPKLAKFFMAIKNLGLSAGQC